MSEEVKQTRFSEEKKCRPTAERGRVLTMKYGKHQMMLIRKRMAIENWLDDRLLELYGGTVDFDIDIDKVLDLNTATERKQYVLDILRTSKCLASSDNIENFLNELMQKLDTL